MRKQRGAQDNFGLAKPVWRSSPQRTCRVRLVLGRLSLTTHRLIESVVSGRVARGEGFPGRFVDQFVQVLID